MLLFINSMFLSIIAFKFRYIDFLETYPYVVTYIFIRKLRYKDFIIQYKNRNSMFKVQDTTWIYTHYCHISNHNISNNLTEVVKVTLCGNIFFLLVVCIPIKYLQPS